MNTFIGLFAGLLTTSSLLPQLIQIMKSRHTKDISLSTYIILTIGVFLWFIYGIMMHDLAVTITNAITFLLAISIVYCKLHFG